MNHCLLRLPALLALALLTGCFGLRTDSSGLADQPGVVGPCYAGRPELIGVGECRLGMAVNWEDADGGIQTTCIGEVLPSKEICNELDDDCDGATDNHGACGSADLGQLGPPGGAPFAVLSDDRVGPGLLRHPAGGVLQDCRDGEAPLACATRFVAEQGSSWGVGDGSGLALVSDGAQVVTSSGMMHVSFRQMLVGLPDAGPSDAPSESGAGPGVPVLGGELHVHLRAGEPHAVLGVTARVLPVRADVPLEATLAAGEVAAGAGVVASGEPELVVFSHGSDPATGARLAVDDPRWSQQLAWQVTTGTAAGPGAHDTVWLAATGKPELLGRASRRLHDVGVQIGSGSTVVWAFPDTGAEPTATASQSYIAAAALGLLGVVDASVTDGVLHAGWDDVTVTWDPDAGDCELSPDVLGWLDTDDAGHVHVCQEAPVLSEVLADAVRHELAHSLLQRVGVTPLPQPDDDEGEAVRHGLVEGIAELAQCASGDGCAWLHSGRDLNASHNPGATDCAAPISVDVANPELDLCKGRSESNRRVVGHALRVAACTLIPDCTATACANAASAPGCGTDGQQRAAAASLLGVTVEAVARGFMPGLSLKSDLATGLVQTCADLVAYGGGGDAGLDAQDCAELQAAFVQVGISDACTNPVAVDVCDGKDNDCDGFTDNPPGHPADHSLTRACTGWDPAWIDGEGPCERGLEICVEVGPHTAVWSGPDSCGDYSVHVAGSEEVCDLIDNDCDGVTDEGLEVAYRFDGDGDGYWTNQQDEALFCPDQAAGEGGPPSSFWTAAEELTGGDDCADADPDQHPGVVEDCDGVDSNCDLKPQGESCPCTAGDPPLVCGPTTGGPGCQSGEQPCLPVGAGGTWAWSQECVGAQFGAAETCNGADDDCDGDVDDGLDDLGPCGLEDTGILQCQGGKLKCQGAAAPNACGGAADLGSELPGVPCGEGLEAGHYVCTAANQTTCVATTGPQTAEPGGQLVAYGHVRWNGGCELIYSQGIAQVEDLGFQPNCSAFKNVADNPLTWVGCRLRLEQPFTPFQPADYYVALTATAWLAQPTMCERKGDFFTIAFPVSDATAGGWQTFGTASDFLVFAKAAP